MSCFSTLWAAPKEGAVFPQNKQISEEDFEAQIESDSERYAQARDEQAREDSLHGNHCMIDSAYGSSY